MLQEGGGETLALAMHSHQRNLGSHPTCSQRSCRSSTCSRCGGRVRACISDYPPTPTPTPTLPAHCLGSCRAAGCCTHSHELAVLVVLRLSDMRVPTPVDPWSISYTSSVNWSLLKPLWEYCRAGQHSGGGVSIQRPC